METTPHIVLFDLYHGGHHGQSMRTLVNYWIEEDLPGRLDVVVSKDFEARFEDIAETAERHASRGVRLVTVEPSKPLNAKVGRLAVLQNDVRIGGVLRRVVRQLRPDHCMLMYFDHLQLSLATRLRFDLPVRFSGMYFRPSFHYRQLTPAPASFKDYINDVQKQFLLWAALRNSHFDTLFSLDPYAVPYVEQLSPGTSVVHLPEVREAADERAVPDARDRLGVEAGREVLLLFGVLDPRKGVLQLLDAVAALPEQLAQKACLVLAGSVSDTIAEELSRRIAHLEAHSGAQVILIDDYVSDEDVPVLFAAASLILLPYQFHVGSSNVLVRAAAAGLPVLGPSYGLLGELIRRRGLGRAVDTTSVEALRDALAVHLGTPTSYPFDAEAARAYASEHSDEAMASTVFQHLLT